MLLSLDRRKGRDESRNREISFDLMGKLTAVNSATRYRDFLIANAASFSMERKINQTKDANNIRYFDSVGFRQIDFQHPPKKKIGKLTMDFQLLINTDFSLILVFHS